MKRLLWVLLVSLCLSITCPGSKKSSKEVVLPDGFDYQSAALRKEWYVATLHKDAEGQALFVLHVNKDKKVACTRMGLSVENNGTVALSVLDTRVVALLSSSTSELVSCDGCVDSLKTSGNIPHITGRVYESPLGALLAPFGLRAGTPSVPLDVIPLDRTHFLLLMRSGEEIKVLWVKYPGTSFAPMNGVLLSGSIPNGASYSMMREKNRTLVSTFGKGQYSSCVIDHAKLAVTCTALKKESFSADVSQVVNPGEVLVVGAHDIGYIGKDESKLDVKEKIMDDVDHVCAGGYDGKVVLVLVRKEVGTVYSYLDHSLFESDSFTLEAGEGVADCALVSSGFQVLVKTKDGFRSLVMGIDGSGDTPRWYVLNYIWVPIFLLVVVGCVGVILLYFLLAPFRTAVDSNLATISGLLMQFDWGSLKDALKGKPAATTQVI